MKPLTIQVPEPVYHSENGPTLTVLPSGYKKHHVILTPGPGKRFLDEVRRFVDTELSSFLEDVSFDGKAITFLFNDDAARAVVKQRFGGG